MLDFNVKVKAVTSIGCEGISDLCIKCHSEVGMLCDSELFHKACSLTMDMVQGFYYVGFLR